MKKVLLCAMLVVLLPNCDFIEDFKNTFKNVQRIENEIEKVTGIETTISFKIHNNEWEHLTIILHTEFNDSLKNTEINEVIKAALMNELGKIPENTYITFRIR